MYTIPLLFDRSTLTLTAIQNENKVIFGVFVVLCIHFKKNKTSSIKLIQKVSSFRYAFVNFFHKFSPSTSYWIVLFFWFQLIRKLNTWNKWKRLEGKSTAHYFGLYAMTFFFYCVHLSESHSASRSQPTTTVRTHCSLVATARFE